MSNVFNISGSFFKKKCNNIKDPYYKKLNYPPQLIIMIIKEILNGIMITFRLPYAQIIERTDNFIQCKIPISDQIDVKNIIDYELS